MNKEELIRQVAKIARKSQADTADVIEALVNVIRHTVVNEPINIPGIGKFSVRARKGFVTRSPFTGEQQITVPDRLAFKFTPCDAIKRKLNAKK